MAHLLPDVFYSKSAQVAGFVLGAIIISLATLTPIEHLPPTPGSDKLHHVLGFAGWAMLCLLGPWRPFMIMAAGMIVWGGMIELIQPSVNRYGEWLDFFADAFGVIMVIVMKIILQRTARRSPSN